MQICTQIVHCEAMNSIIQTATVQFKESEPWLCPTTINNLVTEECAASMSSVTEIIKPTLRQAQQDDLVIGEVLKCIIAKERQNGGRH